MLQLHTAAAKETLKAAILLKQANERVVASRHRAMSQRARSPQPEPYPITTVGAVQASMSAIL